MSRSGMHSFTGGIVLIVIGVLLLLDQLDIASFGQVVRTWWPLILIFIGLRMLWPRRTHLRRPEREAFSDSRTYQVIDSDDIVRNRLFGDSHYKLVSKAFRSGAMQTTAGDTRLDLTELEPAGPDSRLAVSGLFGDIHLRLPNSLPVKITARALFGDVEVGDRKESGFNLVLMHTSEGFEEASKRLQLTVSVNFGDVRVVFAPEEEKA